MKIEILNLLAIFLVLCFSCKDEKKQVSLIQTHNELSQKNIRLFYQDIGGDSIDIRMEYISLLDSIEPSEENERYTFLFLTRENIPTAEMEDIITNDDKQRMKDRNIKGYNMRDKRTMSFHSKLYLQGDNYITVLVEDLAFLHKHYGDSTRIIQKVNTIQEKIDIDAVLNKKNRTGQAAH